MKPASMFAVGIKVIHGDRACEVTKRGDDDRVIIAACKNQRNKINILSQCDTKKGPTGTDP